MRNRDLTKRAAAKLQDRLADEDWMVPAPPPRSRPRTRIEAVPVTLAGDGGFWVPVWIYVKAPRRRRRGKKR